MPPGPKPKIKQPCLKCKQIKKEMRRGYCCACYKQLRDSGELELLPVEAEPTSLTDIQIEIIQGHLLGDGTLYKHKDSHNPHFILQRQAKDLEYLEWSANNLKNTLTSGIKTSANYDNRTKKTYYSAKFITRRLELFEGLYRQWYPDGKKVIPQGLKLTPLMLAIWLADDGCISSSPVKNCYSDVLRMKLSTEGFSKEEVASLADALSTRYSAYFGIYLNGNGYNIQAANKATRSFIDEIDSVWPDGIERKAFWRLLPDVKQDRKHHANSIKTHCKQGHEFTDDNTYRNPSTNHRTCRTCMRIWDSKRNRSKA